jgi:hypothetical protein
VTTAQQHSCCCAVVTALWCTETSQADRLRPPAAVVGNRDACPAITGRAGSEGQADRAACSRCELRRAQQAGRRPPEVCTVWSVGGDTADGQRGLRAGRAGAERHADGTARASHQVGRTGRAERERAAVCANDIDPGVANAVVPVLRNVICFAVLVDLTTCSGNESPPGVTARYVPIPLDGTRRDGPAARGLKATLIWQVAPAASAVGQVLLWMNEEAREPLRPMR